MGLADFLKEKVAYGPAWINKGLLRLNCLGPYAYSKRMVDFRKSIPTINPEQKLVEMANYAIAHVPYYRKRYAGLEVRSIADFQSNFGFIDKEEVMRQPEDFISDVASNYVRMTTSGTSGRPLSMLLPADRYVTEMAFITRFWESIGWKYNVRASFRRGHIPQGRDYTVNPFLRQYQFNVFDTSDEYALRVHAAMKTNGIDTIYSYPSEAYKILKHFYHLGLDTGFIKHALLTSEPVTELQYRFIHDTLGIKISSFYGHTEKLVAGRSLNGHSDFVIEPAYGFAEVVTHGGRVLSREGETGEIVGTTFYNFAMPLLRYRTADYATLGKKIVDTDGVEKQVFSSIQGRSAKNLIYRHDGSYVAEPVLTFHGRLLDHLDGLQFVQERRGYLRALIIPNERFDAADERELRQALADTMLGDEYYTIEKVGTLIVQPNGKLLYLINKTLQ